MGIYYNPNQTNSYTFLNTNPPWSTDSELQLVGRTAADQSVRSLSHPGVCPTATNVISGLIVTPPYDQPTPRMNQWSAGLERQFWNGGGLEVQYLGSHSYHLDRSYYNNTPLPGPGAVNTPSPEQEFRRSDPHHRQRRDRQLRKHERDLPAAHSTRVFPCQVSYTWSHTLDVSTDSNGGGTPMNPYNWRAITAIRTGTSATASSPRSSTTFPSSHDANAVVKGVFANWQANGIVTIRRPDCRST